MSSGEDPLSTWVAAAARDMQGQVGVQDTLVSAARAAVVNIDVAESAGVVILARGGGIETQGCEGRSAVVSTRLQSDLREGPCLTASRGQMTVVSHSVASDERWPRWGPEAARACGVRSVLAAPLFTHSAGLGALTLYSSEPHAFSSHDEDQAVALAAHVAIALAAVLQSDHLRAGLDSRSLIGQAMGIVMERFDLSPAVAFALLSRWSSTHQIKLRVLAEQIVQTRQTPE